MTVTDQIIRAPKPEDWLIYRGNYQGGATARSTGSTRAMSRIAAGVVARDGAGINQATPLVYNGVMYLGNPGDVIQAIDAIRGELMWEYRHPLPAMARCATRSDSASEHRAVR